MDDPSTRRRHRTPETPPTETQPTETPPAENDPSLADENSFKTSAESGDPGLIQEFVWFLRYNKKWWLLPILSIMLLLVALAFVTASPAGPFIYTLF